MTTAPVSRRPPTLYGLSSEHRSRIGRLLFATIAYLPLLLTSPGRVVADTKSYLYLDPGRLLASAGSMWDPKIGLGTSSHQTIGYLFPMGPFYWVTQELLGLPAWVAQRIWLGTLLFAAGMGMRFLLRTLSISGPGVPVAMLAYAFTPYALEYSSRLSVLLGPWSALPWLTALVILSLRVGGWKYPALFALTLQLVSSVNASAVIFALIGPALWFPYALFISREATWRRTWSVAWRIGALTLTTSLWWMSGLWIEGKYGLNILRFTESIKTVSATSYPYEVLRGLGYWFFYGRDRVGQWNDAYLVYSLNSFVIFASLAIPALAMLNAVMIRWRHQVYFAVLTLVGVAIAVAASPYDRPSPLGGIFKNFASTSTAGFALRSTARATPLVAMGLAACLGAGLSAFAQHMNSRRSPRTGIFAAFAVGVLCLTNAVGAWNGSYYSKYLERDEKLPQYWLDALRDLDAEPHDTRVMALPGSDFAAYRWGNTIDPIEPGLIDRPYIARELVPWGSEPTANFVNAFDRRMQELALEPTAIAPIARLMSVGDIVLRMDLETDRFGIAPADIVWATFTRQNIPGTQPAKPYGDEIPGELTFPVFGDLAHPPSQDVDPPPVATVAIDDAQPIVTSRSGAAPVVLSGDGEGLVDAAAANLIDGKQVVLYSATFEDRPHVLRSLPKDSLLIVTDSNRRRGVRWAGLFSNYGYTEAANEVALREDPLDQRLAVFPNQSTTAQTVTELIGVKSLQATGYGSPAFGYTIGDRPAGAFDGDVDTAWVVDNGVNPTQQRLELELEDAITTDHINLVQPEGRSLSRYVSQATIRFDGGKPITVRLGLSSREEVGETFNFPRTTFSKFELTIDKVRQIPGLSLLTQNPIGFSEIRLVDMSQDNAPIQVVEATRMPNDLLESLGSESASRPLVFVMNRENGMDGRTLIRRFDVPTARSFELSGSAQIGTFAKDDAIDRALGLRDAQHGGVTATSSRRLGDPIARASSAIDGDPTTAWNTPVVKIANVKMKVEVGQPIVVDHLNLKLIADGRHSIPTEFAITTAEGQRQTFKIPPVGDIAPASGLIDAPVKFPALKSKSFTFEIISYDPVERTGTVMPAAIAELGIAGVQRDQLPDRLPTTCNTGLIEIDGAPFPVRVAGTSEDAVRQRPLSITPCERTGTIDFKVGEHTVSSKMNPNNPSNPTGIDVTRLILSSGADGAATPAATIAATSRSTATVNPAPELNITQQTRTSMTIETRGAQQPWWLVLGQSISKGWVAKVNGQDLGPSELVNGYANGWRIPEDQSGKPIMISIEWTPQRVVSLALWGSAGANLGCLAIVGFSIWRKRRDPLRRSADLAHANDEVHWRNIHEPQTPFPTSLAAIGIAFGFAALGVLLVAPWAGLVIGIMLALSMRNRIAYHAVRYMPFVIIASVAVYMATKQMFQRYPPRFDWPTFFEPARIPTWIAVLLFAAHGVINVVRPIATTKDRDD